MTNKALILALADKVFERSPFDSPERVFAMVSQYVAYREKWCEDNNYEEPMPGYRAPDPMFFGGQRAGPPYGGEDSTTGNVEPLPAYTLDEIIDGTTS